MNSLETSTPEHWLYRCYLSLFQKHLLALGYRPGSRQSYCLAAWEFLSWWEQQNRLDLHSFCRQEAGRYYAYLSQRPLQRGLGTLGASILRQYCYGLRLFFAFLHASGYLPINPVAGWRPAPREVARRSEVLSRPQMARLYAATETLREQMLLHLYYGCGLRRSEGVALNIQDINLSKGFLEILRGKGNRCRIVPFTHQVAKAFRGWLHGERPGRVRAGETAFLLNAQGQRLSGASANALFQELQSRAGISPLYTLHHLRHSVATHLLGRGLSLEQVRHFLGHQHLESTQVYLHQNEQIIQS
ncbi:MAG: tyrosine-type recombinase/integrase [Cytophagales bacterium]|nr:tyrosine-type recombinase/integrase [Cytophagales bacterium]